jgi:hypothetical protein
MLLTSELIRYMLGSLVEHCGRKSWGNGTAERSPEFYLVRKSLIIYLGAFAKLRQAIISYVMPVCQSDYPSDCQSTWNNSAITGQVFVKFHI